MNEPTFPKAEYGTYDVAEWMRVLSDFPPAHCMREVWRSNVRPGNA